MTWVHFHRPPELQNAFIAEDSLKYCLICLMLAKGDQVENSHSVWKDKPGDGHTDRQHWVGYEPYVKRTIAEAVVIGMSDMLPQAGPMRLCWDHLGGLMSPESQPAEPGPKPSVTPAAALPPGLRGRNGRDSHRN